MNIMPFAGKVLYPIDRDGTARISEKAKSHYHTVFELRVIGHTKAASGGIIGPADETFAGRISSRLDRACTLTGLSRGRAMQTISRDAVSAGIRLATIRTSPGPAGPTTLPRRCGSSSPTRP